MKSNQPFLIHVCFDRLKNRPRRAVAFVRFASALVALVFLASAANKGRAQQGATIQLPVTSNFQVNTVVSAPDGGSMYMGGINRSSIGSTSRGVPLLSNIPGVGRLFKNRAIGGDTSGSHMIVRPTILIAKELEEEMMSAYANTHGFGNTTTTDGRPTNPNGSVETQRRADNISRKIGGQNKR